MKASLAVEYFSFVSAPCRPPFVEVASMLVGVGMSGFRWGGAKGLPSISYWVVGSEASCRVREPSDQRFMRALD